LPPESLIGILTTMITEPVRACIVAMQPVVGKGTIPADQLPMIEAWTALPRFSVERFRLIVERAAERVAARGEKITSACYFDAMMTEAFSAEIIRLTRRPRLMSERSWEEYLAHNTAHYGEPDAATLEWLRSRWWQEGCILGIRTGEDGEKQYYRAPSGSAGAPVLRDFEVAA